MDKTVAFLSLGCKVNAYETESIAEQLKNKGYKVVPFGEPAFITIINTCTVTSMADKKSRQMLHRARKFAPEGIVVAMGCFVQVAKLEELKKELDVNLFIGNKDKDKLVDILEKYLKTYDGTLENKQAESLEKQKDTNNKDYKDTKYSQYIEYKEIQNSKEGNNIYVSDVNDKNIEYENLVLTGTTKHTRAYMKIQDGCNQFCSYCLIVYARGRVRSKDIDTIKIEAKNLLEKGYKEIVLTGIHLSSYGLDKENLSLKDVIKVFIELQEVYPKFRLRLGSLEPRVVEKELLEALKKVKGFCPHFHLSLQSGCDKTLKAMNRKYTAGEYKEKVELIRSYFENPAITTDVIVGFPGESEEDFLISKKFVDEIKFAKMHIFKFSRRKGTRAYDMDEQVDENIKHYRSEELLKIDEVNSREFENRFKDMEVEVLIEESKEIDGKWYDIGHTKENIQVKILIDKKDAGKRDNSFFVVKYV